MQCMASSSSSSTFITLSPSSPTVSSFSFSSSMIECVCNALLSFSVLHLNWITIQSTGNCFPNWFSYQTPTFSSTTLRTHPLYVTLWKVQNSLPLMAHWSLSFTWTPHLSINRLCRFVHCHPPPPPKRSSIPFTFHFLSFNPSNPSLLILLVH